MIILIFDLDGTLIDTLPQYKANFTQVLHKRYGVDKEKSAKIYTSTFGDFSLDKQFRLVLNNRYDYYKITAKDIEIVINDFWRLYNKIEIKAMPGANEALLQLHKKDYKMTLSTNVRTDLASKSLEKVGLRKYFIKDLILGYEFDNPKMRKGIGHYFIIRKKLDIKDSDIIIVVGDGESDMRFAKSQNAIALGKLGTISKDKLMGAGANRTFENLSELPDLIENIISKN